MVVHVLIASELLVDFFKEEKISSECFYGLKNLIENDQVKAYTTSVILSNFFTELQTSYLEPDIWNFVGRIILQLRIEVLPLSTDLIVKACTYNESLKDKDGLTDKDFEVRTSLAVVLNTNALTTINTVLFAEEEEKGDLHIYKSSLKLFPKESHWKFANLTLIGLRFFLEPPTDFGLEERIKFDRLFKLISELPAVNSLSNLHRLYAEGTQNFRSIFLPDIDLSRSNFIRIKCVKKEEMNLFGIDLSRSNLTNIDLSFAKLGGGNFTQAVIRKAILEKTNLANAVLYKAILEEARLVNAVLCRAILEEANLINAELSGAILWQAVMRKADLRGANLEKADLRGADLEEADLRGANLTDADLTGANLNKAKMDDKTILLGADLKNARGVNRSI